MSGQHDPFEFLRKLGEQVAKELETVVRTVAAAVAPKDADPWEDASAEPEPATEQQLDLNPATYTYDPEAHALYLHVVPESEGRIVSTATMAAIVNADLDENGRVLGVEILNPWPTGAEASAVPEEEP